MNPHHRKAGHPCCGLQPVSGDVAVIGLYRGGFRRLAEGGARGRRETAGGSVQTEPVSGAGNSQIVTQIFRLNYESANNLVPILRPLISPNNTITGTPATTRW